MRRSSYPYQKQLDTIKKYKKKEIIIDTAPLVLLLVGLFNPKKIGVLKPTHEYSIKDYELLKKFLANFKSLIITPQILTEVSNMLKNKCSSEFRNIFKKNLQTLIKSHELYIEKNDILKHTEFKNIGLTDVSVILCYERWDRLILTKDFDFVGICRKRGIPIIHFDELRGMYWSGQ